MALITAFTRLIVTLTGPLLLAILLIHARPYDGGHLRDLLVPPPGCALPCFLGVHPGVTTTADAIGILEAHPWIGQVVPSTVKDVYRIDLIETFAINTQLVPAPLMRVEDDVVRWIFWRAAPVSRGDLYLTLGQPGTMRVIHDQIEGTLPLLLVYPEYQLSIITPLSICQLTQANFWRSYNDWNGIYIGDIGPSNYFARSNTGLLLPSSELDLAAWVRQLRQFEDCLE